MGFFQTFWFWGPRRCAVFPGHLPDVFPHGRLGAGGTHLPGNSFFLSFQLSVYAWEKTRVNEWVNECVCVCACVRACMHACVFLYIGVWVGVCVRACVRVCMFLYIGVWVGEHMYEFMLQVCVSIFVCVCVCKRACVCVVLFVLLGFETTWQKVIHNNTTGQNQQYTRIQYMHLYIWKM